MPGDEGAGGQLEDQTAIHLFVEVEVEVVEGPERVAELGLFAPALQHAVGAAGEFIGDQAGEIQAMDRPGPDAGAFPAPLPCLPGVTAVKRDSVRSDSLRLLSS
jgi:hypothetical protein